MLMQGDKAKVSEHIEAPELYINTNIRQIRVRRRLSTYDAQLLIEDLLCSVLTLQHTVFIFVSVSLTRKSTNFEDYCTCQLCTGSELATKLCQYEEILRNFA